MWMLVKEDPSEREQLRAPWGTEKVLAALGSSNRNRTDGGMLGGSPSFLAPPDIRVSMDHGSPQQMGHSRGCWKGIQAAGEMGQEAWEEGLRGAQIGV